MQPKTWESFVQVRDGSLLKFDYPKEGFEHPSWQKPPSKKSYAGEVTDHTRKRIITAVDILLQKNPNRRIYNPIIQKEHDFRVSFATLTISDNGPDDDSPLVGRIEVEEACAGDYALTLSFDGALLSCDIVEDEAAVNNAEDDAVVTFEVDDCSAAALTATPSATPTSTPTASPTATSTATPVPTATSVPPTPVIVVQTVVTERVVEVVRITPPVTGDGGLLE